jgi:hypothetical protein
MLLLRDGLVLPQEAVVVFIIRLLVHQTLEAKDAP